MLSGSVVVMDPDLAAPAVEVYVDVGGPSGVRRWALHDAAGIIVHTQDLGDACPRRDERTFPLPRPRTPLVLRATDCGGVPYHFTSTSVAGGTQSARRPCPPPNATRQTEPHPDDAACEEAVATAAEAVREANELCRRIQHLRRLSVTAFLAAMIALLVFVAIVVIGANVSGGIGLIFVAIAAVAALATAAYFDGMGVRYAGEVDALREVRRPVVARWRRARDVALRTCCAQTAIPDLPVCTDGE